MPMSLTRNKCRLKIAFTIIRLGNSVLTLVLFLLLKLEIQKKPKNLYIFQMKRDGFEIHQMFSQKILTI